MNSVTNGETIIKRVIMHWSVFIIPVAMTGLFFAIHEGLGFIGIIYVIYIGIKYATTELVITTRKVHGKQGVIQIRQLDSPLNRINDIHVHKNIVGNLFGCGSIDICTSSGSNFFRCIPTPEVVRNTILTAADQMEGSRLECQSIGREEVKALSDVTEENMEEKKRTTYKRKADALWISGCPILISQCLIESDENGLGLNLEIQNNGDVGLEAIYLDVQGFDVLKKEKCRIDQIALLDLHIASQEQGFILKPIPLQDESIRRVKLYIRHVVFEDESIWSYDADEALKEIHTIQEAISQDAWHTVEKLCKENEISQDICQYSKYPLFEDEYWICACGQFNRSEYCAKCKEKKETIERVLSEKVIGDAYKQGVIEAQQQREEQEAGKKLIREDKEKARREKTEQMQSAAKNIMLTIREKASEVASETAQKVDFVRKEAITKTQTKQEVSNQQETIDEDDIKHTEIQLAEGMMHCKTCGKQIKDTAKFCPFCGSAAQRLDFPVQESVPVLEELSQKEIKKGKRILWKVLGAVLIIGVGSVMGIMGIRFVKNKMGDGTKKVSYAWQEESGEAEQETTVSETVVEKETVVEGEILRIREVYNDVVSKKGNGEFRVNDEGSGKRSYFDENETLIFRENSGEEYLYDNGKLIFAFSNHGLIGGARASSLVRYYFKENQLFHLKIEEDGRKREYDVENGADWFPYEEHRVLSVAQYDIMTGVREQKNNSITGRLVDRQEVELEKVSELLPLKNPYSNQMYCNQSSHINQEGHDNTAQVVFDRDEMTSWQEGVEGYGIGEEIEVNLYAKNKVRYIAFKLGNWRNDDYYKTNSRPRSLRIYGGGLDILVEFPDGKDEYWLELSSEFLPDEEGLHFEIESIYPGEKYDDTCLAEITFYGDKS